MVRICPVLIHNFDLVRNRDALATVDSLRRFSKTMGFGATHLVGWQPVLKRLNLQLRIKKFLFTQSNFFRWESYLNFGHVSLSTKIRQVLAFIYLGLIFVIDFRKENFRSEIEIELTQKHVQAWQYFLNSSDAWLMVVEDDVRLTDKPKLAIKALEDRVSNSSSELCPYFISLSAPYSIEELGAEGIVSNLDSSTVMFARPCSNTTAAYMLNRAAAEILVSLYRENRNLFLLSSDSLLNELFMIAVKRGIKFECEHVMPELLANATVIGYLKSSIN